MLKFFEPYIRQLILLLSQFLTFEYAQPQFIQLILIILVQLQPLSFSFYNIYHTNKVFEFSLESLITITRPYLFFAEQVNDAIILGIAFSIQQLILFYTFYVVIINQRNSQETKSWQIKFICYYFYLFSTLFYSWMLELCLINTNIYGIILSCIAFLEIIFIVLSSDLIFQGVLILKGSTQLPLNSNTTNCIIKPLRIIQILIFYYTTDYVWSFNIQNLLTLLIQLLYIYQIIQLKLYAQKIYVLFSLTISSVSCVLSIEAIITQHQPQGNLWLLLSGLIVYVLLNQHNITLNDVHQLKYLYSVLENLDCNRQEDRFFMQLLLFQHESRSHICKLEKNIKQQLLQIIESNLEQCMEQRTINYVKTALDFCQILFRKRQFVKAQQVINKIFEKDNYQLNNQAVGLVSECLFIFLKQQIDIEVLIQMTEKMMLINPSSKQIAESLKQFAINDNSDQYIQQQLRKMIFDKIQFYYTFIEHSNKYQGNVDYSLKVIQDLQAFRLELIERYEKFPTISNQNILKFYLLEVLNDYIEAYNLHKNKAFDDEKYSMFHDSVYTKLLGQNPTYVAAEINKDLDVVITRQSKKASSRFQKIYGSKWKSQGEINLHDYLPEYVLNVHKSLIQQFLDEGINKFYQQQNLSFLKIYDRVMMPVEMMVGLNQNSEQSFSFLIFFYEQLDYRSYIVVNQNSEMINCSDNISSQILSCNNSSQGLISCKSFGMIHNIIPEFDEMIHSQIRFFFNQVIRLPSKSNSTQKTNEYITNITIDKKFKDEDQCFMIILDNIRNNNPRYLSESRLETSIYQRQNTFDKWVNIKKMNEEIDENVDKYQPYQEIYDQCFLKKVDNQNDQTQPFESKLYVAELLPVKQNREPVKKVFSPKDSMNEQFIMHREDVFHNEVRDYVSGSSVTAIKRSKFYKKFEIIYFLCKSAKRSTKIQRIYANYLLLFSVILIYASIHLTFIQNISGFISDIQLLAVRFDVTEPLESFTVSRYTLINYKEMLGRKVINATYSAQLQKFPLSCLQDAFSDMKDGMANVLSRNEIDQLQNVSYIPIMMYTGPNYQAEAANVTQRSLIIITLNYQYDFRINLQNGGGGFDTPFFYFTYKDYQIIKSTLDNLNVVILQITIDRSVQEITKWLYGLVPFLCANFLITVFIVFQFIKHNNEKNQIMKYIQSFDIEVIESEKQRLQYLSTLVYSDLDSIKSFIFDVDQIDCNLQKSNLKQKQINQKKNHCKINNQNPYSGIMFSVFHFAIFCTFSIYLYLTFIIYFQKYQKTAIFYQQLSDLGVDIPAIYAQKEILFRLKNRYPFLNATDINETYYVIQKSLEAVQIYQQNNLQLNSNDYLFDKSLVDFFMSINSGNLCEYQSDDLKEKTQIFCPQIMKGNLVQGFQQTLVYIINSVQTQQQETTNFTVQPSSTLLELEGSTVLTDIIKTMKERFYENLVNSAETLIESCSIITSVYLVFESLFALFYFYFLNTKTHTEFSTLKKSVYLFPRYTLLFDDSFYRNFISIIREEEFLE